MHFRNSNFNVKTAKSNEKTANPAKTCARKILRTQKKFTYTIAAVILSKIYFLKNAKKTYKPNNRDLNHD